MKAALEKKMYCIALSGKEGGEMSLYAHINLIVPSQSTQRIQEMHLHIIHTFCSLIEKDLFESAARTAEKTTVAIHAGLNGYRHTNGKIKDTK